MRSQSKRVEAFEGPPWSVQRLLHHSVAITIRGRPCRARLGLKAAALWLAIEEKADAQASLIITPTREELADVTGITSPKTISSLLTVLHNAGWIECHAVPKYVGGEQVASFIKIGLRRKVSRLPRARSTKKHVMAGKRDGEAPPAATGNEGGVPSAHPDLVSRNPFWQQVLNCLFEAHGLEVAKKFLGVAFNIPRGGGKITVFFMTPEALGAADPYKALLSSAVCSAGRYQTCEVEYALEEENGASPVGGEPGRQGPAPNVAASAAAVPQATPAPWRRILWSFSRYSGAEEVVKAIRRYELSKEKVVVYLAHDCDRFVEVTARHLAQNFAVVVKDVMDWSTDPVVEFRLEGHVSGEAAAAAPPAGPQPKG